MPIRFGLRTISATSRSRRLNPRQRLNPNPNPNPIRENKAGRSSTAPAAGGYHFRRGFAEEIEVEAKRFIEKAKNIVRMAPVRHVRLIEAAGHMDAVAKVPQLEQMLSLELRECGLGDEACRAIASSPHLGKLRWLGLGWNRITEAGVEALARSDRLPNLQFVQLIHNDTKEPYPVPAGLDIDGSYQDVDKSALHHRLVSEVGRKPWLVTAWPSAPDMDAV